MADATDDYQVDEGTVADYMGGRPEYPGEWYDPNLEVKALLVLVFVEAQIFNKAQIFHTIMSTDFGTSQYQTFYY